MKKNKRGFTLIEVIIAISIFTIVLGLGYKVLNKTNISMAQQQVITDGQMNANLVNKYLTKDLELCKKLILPNYTNTSEYEYIIKKDTLQASSTDDIKYKVVKINKNSNTYYNVDRITNSNSIEIISNQLTTTESPFIISSNLINKNIYEVELDYNIDEKIKSYKFNVAPRFLEASTNGANTSQGDVGDIRFGYNDKNIWTKIDPKKNGAQNITSESKPFLKNQIYQIKVYIDRQNAKSYSQIIGTDLNATATSNANFFKDKEFNSIKFAVKDGLEVNLNVKIKYKNNSTPLEINLIKDSNGVQRKLTSPITVKNKNENQTSYEVYTMPQFYDKKQELITITGTIKRVGDINYTGQEQLIMQIGKDLK